jgi:integrase
MGRKRKLPPGLWDRNGTYHARFRAGGRLIRKRLSRDFDAACTLLRELRARADKADFNLLDNDYPWADLKSEFVRWVKQTHRRPHEYEADLKHFERYAPVRSIRQIDQQYVFAFRTWRLGQSIRGKAGARTVTPRTVNREVATLQNMLNRGVDWKRIGSNPIADVKPLCHDRLTKERRALTTEEVERLFEESPSYLRPVWRMFMCTGIRKAELVGLTFNDVDFERRVITISAEQSKNHKAREIPLDDGVHEMVCALRESAKHRRAMPGYTTKQTEQQARSFTRDHVFVTKANTPLRHNLLLRFYAICKKADIEGAEPGGSVDIHSLRVTFTTLALEHGASPKAVQAILGHSTLALTMGVYARATERSKRDAIGVLPFAKVSAPDHVIAVQTERRARTSSDIASQPQMVVAVR